MTAIKKNCELIYSDRQKNTKLAPINPLILINGLPEEKRVTTKNSNKVRKEVL